MQPNIPIIRVEMEGVRAGVLHHMRLHNAEFDAMIQETLSQTLTEEWVGVSIQENVNQCVQSAIDNLGDNWQLRNAVSNALGEALANMIHPIKTYQSEIPTND